MSVLVNAAASVLFAPCCAACGAPLETFVDGCVCGWCWQIVPRLARPIVEARGAVSTAGAAGEYEGSLRSIIHAFKYDKRRSLAHGLAALMLNRAGEILEGADCAVPVPLHRRRQRERGFNQARELAQRLGLPVVEMLVRRRPTLSQVELAADRRRANVEGVFSLRRRWLRGSRTPEGLTVVLIDDVSTTGATLEACGVVLQRAGVREVRALTAARVTVNR